MSKRERSPSPDKYSKRRERREESTEHRQYSPRNESRQNQYRESERKRYSPERNYQRDYDKKYDRRPRYDNRSPERNSHYENERRRSPRRDERRFTRKEDEKKVNPPKERVEKKLEEKIDVEKEEKSFQVPKRRNYKQYEDDVDENDEIEEDFPIKKEEIREKEDLKYDPKLMKQKPQNEYILQTGIETKGISKETKPLSIDEIKNLKEIQEKTASKPVFKSKQERKSEKLQEQDERKKKIEEMRRERENILKKRSVSQVSTYDTYNSHLKPEEIEDIKKSYMNPEKPQQKPLRTIIEKTKLNFEWDNSEDTSRDINPLYDQKHEALILFGRAGRAGEVDKKTNFYDEFIKEKTGNVPTHKRISKFETEDKRNWKEKKLEEMTSRDWRIFCEDYEIQTKGGNVEKPFRNWKESNIPPKILDVIEKIGYKTPTPIQMQCIPIAMAKRDLIGLSETGSGKTMAYVVPLLSYILKRSKTFNSFDGPLALVLAPTRELALQIETETKKFSDPLGIRVVSIIGGVSQEKQNFMMQGGAEIVIATPGRLISSLESLTIVLNQCYYVVLDECDKMIQMGFEEQVNQILEFLPLPNESEDQIDEKVEFRQTLMFSATMPPGVEKIASKYMNKKVVVTIGELGRAVKKIDQRVEFIDEEMKRKRLSQVFEEVDSPILVFVNFKKGADALQKFVEKLGYRSIVLHSKKSQDARNYALEGFKTGKFEIMIATNVMSRGIDVDGIKTVINYDMPTDIEDYIHRIGRTARGGKTGVAISFIKKEDTDIMYDLKQYLEKSEMSIPQELLNHESALIKPGTIKNESNILK